MKMRFQVLAAAAVVMAGMLVGCGDNSSGNKAAPSGSSSTEAPAPVAPAAPAGPVVGMGGGKPQIGFVPRTDASEKWSSAIHAGAEKAVAEGKKGADGKPVIGVLWQGSTKTGEQVAVAKGMLEKGVAAIVIAPEDETSLTGVVAAAGHVPVIAIDSLPGATGAPAGLRCTIGQDGERPKEFTTKMKGYVVLHGSVPSKDEVAELKAGKTDAIAFLDPMEVGALAVKTASDCIKEKTVQSRIDVPWHVVTRENVDSVEVAPAGN